MNGEPKQRRRLTILFKARLQLRFVSSQLATALPLIQAFLTSLSCDYKLNISFSAAALARRPFEIFGMQGINPSLLKLIAHQPRPGRHYSALVCASRGKSWFDQNAVDRVIQDI